MSDGAPLGRGRASTPVPQSGGEETRRQLQDRLALLGWLGTCVSTALFLVGVLTALSGLAGEWRPQYHAPSGVSSAILALLWLACRRGRRSLGVLHALDAGIVFCLSQVSALLLFRVVPADVRLYTMLLAISYALIGRTLIVPSTPRRSLLVGAVSFAPFLWFVNAIDSGPHAVWITIWAGLALSMATLGSGVIYGLRREVREARRLGQYTLEEKLGEGGMGLVYRARHALLRRPTAIKLLPPEKAGEANIRRFEREVQLTAQLSHPNTVSVFDFGRTPEGVFYYVMEYLDGLDLEQLVKEDGPQPPARVVHVLKQVCGSLAEAHGIGLIHRDIKPGNIILCHRGGQPDVAKVVDFGLVKDLEKVDGLTNVELIGTPLYLAPESITGDRIDGRHDIYALGAVGYFLLTGLSVFDGATLIEVCSHHLHTPPVPPSQRRGRPLPPKLERWVLDCLEKDPLRRPQSAEAAAEGLDGCDDVGEWRTEQARQWWTRRASRVGAARTGAVPDADPGGRTATMPVDLRGRAPRGAGPGPG